MSRLDHVDLTDADAIMAAAIADAQEKVAGPMADPFTCSICGTDDGGHTRACELAVPLELCNGSTPQCPHYECPDGWHDGEAPNCSCTPDCALEDDDDDAE